MFYSKLFVDEYEFDLATADPKSDIKRVLKSSKMKKDKNYRLLIVQEPVKQGGFVKSNHYMMTPNREHLAKIDKNSSKI